MSIAVLALGGQGGGVLTQWIASLGGRSGFRAQATSVPGVAQRTGATVYYIEMIPWIAGDPEPVFALMPTPGDVDIVIASELMEAGRAMIRGFVSPDRTTLISSTHRVYAISEKSARGNGIADSATVTAAAGRRAKRLIEFDMSATAEKARCAISAVLFGALAGSEVLPFPKSAYVEAMQSGGKGTDANLAGFNAGMREALGVSSRPTRAADAAQAPFGAAPVPLFAAQAPPRTAAPVATDAPAEPTTAAGRALQARVFAELPRCCHNMAIEGVRKLVDYQDPAYAAAYLDHLARLRTVDHERSGWPLTREATRYLALFMAHDDTIRVADLKVRDTRLQRIRTEVRIRDEQLLGITEFMHPRFQELCDTLPAWAGQRLPHSRLAARLLRPFFRKGRFIETTSLTGFVILLCLASLRRWRRATSRYLDQQQLLSNWLQLVRTTATTDLDAAVEIIRCQRLLKGYGETYENGLVTFNRIIAAYEATRGESNAASRIRTLREAALAST